VLTPDLNLIFKAQDARHALAAMDAKLPLMKCVDSSRNRDNPLLGIDFDHSEARKMLPGQKSFYSSFQVAV